MKKLNIVMFLCVVIFVYCNVYPINKINISIKKCETPNQIYINKVTSNNIKDTLCINNYTLDSIFLFSSYFDFPYDSMLCRFSEEKKEIKMSFLPISSCLSTGYLSDYISWCIVERNQFKYSFIAIPPMNKCCVWFNDSLFKNSYGIEDFNVDSFDCPRLYNFDIKVRENIDIKRFNAYVEFAYYTSIEDVRILTTKFAEAEIDNLSLEEIKRNYKVIKIKYPFEITDDFR